MRQRRQDLPLGEEARDEDGGVATLKDFHGNPLLELDLPNFVLTPHVAWTSREAMQTLADRVIDNIEAFVRGEPQSLVN